jgi:hypothetical protein
MKNVSPGSYERTSLLNLKKQPHYTMRIKTIPVPPTFERNPSPAAYRPPGKVRRNLTTVCGR